MRRISKIICIALAALVMMFSLSGCVQMVINMDIKADGSADINIKAGLANQVHSMLSEQDPLSETKQEAESNGYAVEAYSENDYTGIIMTKHIASLETAAEADSYTEGLTIKREKHGLKNSMTLSGTLTGAESFKQNMADSAIDISDFDMKLIITVPYRITNTNASQLSEDKKTATFDLTTLDAIELECAGDVMLFGAIPMTAASIVVLILALCAVILIIVGAVKKKKRHSTTEALTDENTSNDSMSSEEE